MAQEEKVIGTVALIEGRAFARGKDGKQRELKVGDAVLEGEILITPSGARVELSFDSGKKFLLREKESVSLDSAVIGNELPDGRDAALLERVGELADITRAIAEGSSLDQLLEETSVGLTGGIGEDGHNFVQIFRIFEFLASPEYDYGTLDRLRGDDTLVGGVPGEEEERVPVVMPVPTITVTAPDYTNDSTPTITGTTNAVDGSTVTLTVVDFLGVTQTLTATVSSGTYSATPGAALAEGGYTVTAKVSDSAGKSAEAADDGSIDVTAPTITVSAPDNTSDTTPTITGTTDAPNGSKVTLTVVDSLGATQTLIATVHGGTFSVTPGRALPDGGYTVIAGVTDDAGNTGSANDVGSVDTTPPTASVTLTANITADDVINAAEAATNIAVTGTVGGDVQVGDTVTLTVNGTAFSGLVTTGGSFSIAVPGSDLVADGDHTIAASVTTTDAAGNSATASDTETYTVDTTPPTVTVAAPDNTTDTTPTITGTTDAANGSTVTLTVVDFLGATQTLTATVSAGTYSVAPGTALAEGSYTVSASVADTAGNTGTASDNGSIDLTPPTITVSAPDNTADSTPTITGTTDAANGSTVTLTVVDFLGATQTLTATVSGGTYSVAPGTALAEGSYTVSASVADTAGNTGTASDNGSIDVTPPTLTISVGDSTLTAGQSTTVTFQFSEAVSNFASGDVSVVGGSLTAFTQVDADTWTATFTQSGTATPSISVANASYTDTAGNNGSGDSLTLGLEPGADTVTRTGNEDTTISITLSGSDIDGTIASFKLTSLPSTGRLYRSDGTTMVGIGDTIPAGDATLKFVPFTEFAGSVTFNYTATDNSGLVSSPALATINVTAVNDGTPVAANDSITLPTGATYFISKESLLGNDTLYDAAAITSWSLPTGVTAHYDGSVFTGFDFDPTAAGGVGSYNFTYTITDNDQPTHQTSTATVTVTVVNATDDFATVNESALTTGSGGGTAVATGNLFSGGGESASDITNINGVTPVGGVITITNATGTLVVQATGASRGNYTYTLNAEAAHGAPGSATDTTLVQDFTYTKADLTSAVLHVSIIDDKPVATNMTVEIPESPTPAYNLMLTLDVSGSMLVQGSGGGVKRTNADGSVSVTTRMQMAQDALCALVDEYFRQSPDVTVSLAIFGTSAMSVGSYSTAAAAKAAINGLTTPANDGSAVTTSTMAAAYSGVGASTNYEAALDLTRTTMGTGSATAQNIVYFLSDGVPTAGDTTINIGTAGDPYNDYVDWLATNANPIKSFGVGIGTGIADTTYLDVAHNVDSAGDGVEDAAIMVPDLNDLGEQLISTVPQGFGGNVVVGSAATSQNFGADGGYVQSIKVWLDSDHNGIVDPNADTEVTFTFDGSGTITASSAGYLNGQTFSGTTLTLNDIASTTPPNLGFIYGTLVFDFTTGDYTYFTGTSATMGDQFTLTSTVRDSEGDLATSVQTISIIDGKPVANDDTDTLKANADFMEGNVISGAGTDAGIGIGSQFTAFAVEGSGVDKITDNAVVTSITFHNTPVTLGNWSAGVYTPVASGSGTIDGYAYTVTNGKMTWNGAGGQQLIFDDSGYYKYTPPTADVPAPGYLVNASPSQTITFSGQPAGITLEAIGSDGLTYAETALAYQATGVGLNSATGDADNTRLDTNERLKIMFDSTVHPNGVDAPSVTLNVGTAGNISYTVYNASGAVIGGPTTVATGSLPGGVLSLAAYNDVGRVDVQALTARVRVTSTTFNDDACFKVDLTSAGNVSAAGLTLDGLTSTNTPAYPTVTRTFTAAPADITLQGLGTEYPGAPGTYAEGSLSYNADGVGLNSSGDASANRLDTNEALVVNYDAASYPSGVNDPTFAIAVNTAGTMVYTVYNTSGAVIGGPTSVATATSLSLTGYSNVGAVKIQATGTARIRVTSTTYADPAGSTVSYDATNGVSVGAAASGVGNLESLVLTFNHATYPNGVQNVSFAAVGVGAGFTYAVYGVDGQLIGRVASNTNTVTIPPEYGYIGKIIVEAPSNDTATIQYLTFQGVANVAAPSPVAPEEVTYTLTDSTLDTDTAVLSLNVISNSYVGTDAGETLTGSSGNDAIYGLGGADSITGGAGHDVLEGGAGADTIYGGADNDVLAGGADNDKLYGEAGADTLRGQDGADTLEGGTGNDRLEGGAGADSLEGGAGGDTLVGGAGNDTLSGGLGDLTTDVFRWELADRGFKGSPAVDTVTDFDVGTASTTPGGAGGDVLDLRDLLVGESHPSGAGNLANFLHFELTGGGDTKVHISSTGGFGGGFSASLEDQVIVLQGVDLLGSFSTDQQIIQDLLNKNKLITD